MKHGCRGVLFALLTIASPVFADTGKVTVSLVGEASIKSWMRGSDSWQDLSGQLSIDNGLALPLDGITLNLTYYRAMLAMPGETPQPMKAGEDEATIWFAAPIAAGAKQEVPLQIRIHNAPLVGFSKGVELHVPTAFSGKHKVRVVAAPSPASAEGIQATVSAPSEVDTWLTVTGVDAGSPTFATHLEGDVKVRLDNHGQGALRSVTLVAMVGDQEIELSSYQTQWGNGFLMPGKSDEMSLMARLDRPVPDATGAIRAELALPLAPRKQVFGVEPAPVIVQKATPLKAAPKGGATLAKLKRGDFVVEVADGDPMVEVRTASGARGFIPVKALVVPLVVHGKKIRKAFARQTADGLYIDLCSEANEALGVFWDDMGGFVLKAGKNKLHLNFRGGPGKLTTPDGEREVVLDPVPYGKGGGSCGIVHEHALHELGIDLR